MYNFTRYYDTFYLVPDDIYVSKLESEGGYQYRLVHTKKIENGIFQILQDLQDEQAIIKWLNERLENPINRIEDLDESASFYFDRESQGESFFDQLVLFDCDSEPYRVGPIFQDGNGLSMLQLWNSDFCEEDLHTRILIACHAYEQIKLLKEKSCISWTAMYYLLIKEVDPQKWPSHLESELRRLSFYHSEDE